MTTGGFTRAGPPTPRGGFSGQPDPERMGGEPETMPEDEPADDRGLDADSDTRGQTGPDRTHADLLRRWADPTQTLNIAQEILEDKENFPDGMSLLGQIGQLVVREYEIDNTSRADWLARSKKAMELAMQVTSPKSNPWEGAANIIYPLISSASVQFAARAYPAIVPGEDIVKGYVVGRDDGFPQMGPDGQPLKDPQTGQVQWAIKPGSKRDRADRIAEHMSWQFTEEQTEWQPETDRLLLIVPIVGCCFRKTYYDSNQQRNFGVLVRAENLVVNYRAKSMETAPRITEELKLYPYEITEEENAGTFLPWEYGMAEGAIEGDEDAPHEFLEQHRRYDLDDDGYPEPYIVTVHKQTAKVVRIVARWDPDEVRFSAVNNKIQRIKPVEYYTQYDFLPNPDGGIYGVGFGQLLNPINDAINSSLNQMFDAGSLAITGGGFIGKGLSMQSGQLKFRLGEWKLVNALGSTVKDAIVPFAHPGPNPVMMTLLEFLVEAGKELAANAEVLTGQQSQSNVPATTTMALIEQGLNVFKAIYKRIYLALTGEFQKQYRLNRLYLNKQVNYRRGNEWVSVSQDDYTEHTGVMPISDPNMITDLQQLARAEALKETFMNDFWIDQTELRKRIMTALHVQDQEKLIHDNPMQNPMMMLKMRELGIQELSAKSMALYHLMRGYQAMALADKAVGDQHLDWLSQHFKMLQDELDRLNSFYQPPPPGAPQPPEPLLTEVPKPLGFDPPQTGRGVSQSGSPIENVGEAGLTNPRS